MSVIISFKCKFWSCYVKMNVRDETRHDKHKSAALRYPLLCIVTRLISDVHFHITALQDQNKHSILKWIWQYFARVLVWDLGRSLYMWPTFHCWGILKHDCNIFYQFSRLKFRVIDKSLCSFHNAPFKVGEAFCCAHVDPSIRMFVFR